jgi:uncharacterized protein (TIGR03086 family)
VDDIVTLHRQALDRTGEVVAGVGADQWGAATPCDGWDARELLNHIVSGNLWVVELAGGRTIDDVGDALDGDALGDDPLGAYRSSAGKADAAFSAPGVMDAPVAVSYGPIPGSAYASDRLVDVLIHGWDLAVATGQDTSLDPTLVEACWEAVAPHAEMLRASGMFGGDVDVPDGASRQTQLLALLGRREGG